MVWFSRSWGTDRYSATLHQKTREPTEKSRRREAPLMGGEREFVRRALPKYRQLRAEGWDLFLPLSMVTASSEDMYVEQRFAMLFMALEHLRDHYANKKQVAQIVDEPRYRDVRSALKAKVKEMVASGQLSERAAELMIEKVGELNRPSLWGHLEPLFAEYRVEWRDLYPPGLVSDRPPFIQIRNLLFHTGKKVSVDRLWLESLRLRAVLDRFFLSALGWHRPSDAPVSYREVLSRELGDEPL